MQHFKKYSAFGRKRIDHGNNELSRPSSIIYHNSAACRNNLPLSSIQQTKLLLMHRNAMRKACTKCTMIWVNIAISFSIFDFRSNQALEQRKVASWRICYKFIHNIAYAALLLCKQGLDRLFGTVDTILSCKSMLREQLFVGDDLS